MERTLVVLKPDAIQRGIVGDVIGRFEKIGLKIIGVKMVLITEEIANKHYPVTRTEFIEGMGKKTLENYKEQGMDPKKEMGTESPKEIGLMVQKWLVKFITSDPVVAIVLEGPHAVELVRKVCGHTLPAKALPGTIRGDYSFDSSYLANSKKRPIRNLIHASGTVDEAEYEISLWFSETELYTYDTVHGKHMIA